MDLFKLIKNILFCKVLVAVIAIIVGSSVFNHFDAWAGATLIITGLLILVSVLISFFDNNKNSMAVIALAVAASLGLSSCERVAPNYAGVLMENYGKEGKTDFSIVTGKVPTFNPGTELFQVPLFDQRGEFADPVTLKAADNTQFSSRPTYSYKVIKERAVDVVFDNKQIGSGSDFMRSLEDNILEPRIYDLIKEESRKYSTDTLMAERGSLKFEKALEIIIEDEFNRRGLELITFSAQIDFSDKVKEKIDTRNEVNTNLSVLDQQIEEQKKRNELAKLKAEENKILSSGITPQILQQQFIEKWDGQSTLYNNPIPIMKVNM